MEESESWVRRTKFSHSIFRTTSSTESLATIVDRLNLDGTSLDQGLELGACGSTSDFSSMSNVSSYEVITENSAASSSFGKLTLESIRRNRRSLSATKLDESPGARARRFLLGQSPDLDTLLKNSRERYGVRNSRLQRNHERVVSFSDLKDFSIANDGRSIRGGRSRSPTSSFRSSLDFREGRSLKRYSTLQPRRRMSSEGHHSGHISSLPDARSVQNISSMKGSEKVRSRRDSWPKMFDRGTVKVAALSISVEWTIDRSKLLIGHKFASGAHSKLFYGKYDEKPVAIKFIRQPDNAENNELATRLEKQFNRELNMLSHLYHRNVIKLVGAYRDPPVFCIITEYLGGGSLRMFMHKLEHKSPPLPKLISIALDIARGMYYIHSQGVIHRDLKPENIIFDEEFCAKIVDYGIACEEAHCDVLEEDEGTYRWMAPEMMRHKQYGRKVDVYSFGLLLWEMFTGTTPYEEMTPIQAAFAVVDKNLRPVIPSECPAALCALIEHCWASQPDKRPEFWEVVTVLEQFDSVLRQNGSLSSIPSILEHHDHKNWFAHLIEKFKQGQPDGFGPLPIKML